MPTSFEPSVLPELRNEVRSHPTGLLNPYFLILLGAMFATASEIFLKKGAQQTVQLTGTSDLMSLAPLATVWVWIAIAFYIASFSTWLHVLRFVPLSIAFNLSSIIHVFVPLSCWFFLGEDISPIRWFGISLVLLGIGVIARPFVSIEEKL
jgi:multidrug transporter EmrE-like cation transporter